MRKLLALMLVLGLVVFSTNVVNAQEEGGAVEEAVENVEQAAGEAADAIEGAAEDAADAVEDAAEDAADAAGEAADAAADAVNDAVEAATPEPGSYQILKEKFIQGGWGFMLAILITLIFGLALCIERIITLNIASVNTEKLLARVDDSLKSGDINGAMEVCRSTAGPTASVLYEGLRNATNGPDAVEKAIVSYGSVQMGLLEKGLVWISLVIALAPMLGFCGTVIGMINAFDNIERVGDISPTIVAGGIKVALLTTVFGLIVAMIMQVLYNYIVSKIDGLTHKMEEASVALVDMMMSNNSFK